MRKAGSATAMALFLTILLASVFACPSVATDTEQKQYLLLKLGGYFPQHSDMEDYNDGFNGELYYGRYFHQYVSSELGAGYFRSNISDPSFNIKVFDILYNIKGIYRIGRIELFAGPGVGLYFAKGYSPPSGLTTEWNTAFGYHVLAGGSIDLSTEWFLGLEGKYFWAKTKDPVIPQGGVFGTHLDGIMATASVGYRF
jgi:opacity protein-like surface antigen